MTLTHLTAPPTLTGLAAAFAIALFAAQPCSAEETETRPLGPFNKVQTSSGVSVTVVCGAPARAVVEASSGGLERVKTEIEGGVLIVRMRGMGSWTGSSKVTVSAAQPLEGIEASSGSSVKVDGCAVAPTSFSAQSSSGSQLKIDGGKTNKADLKASSGSSLNAGDLVAVEGTIEGSSGASIRACKVRASAGHASSGASVAVSPDSAAQVEVSSGGSWTRRGC